MRIIKSVKEMSAFAQRAKAQKKSLGFVPTMGALHEGHLSLLRQCKKDNDVSILSIFVNPTQFGPNEDFSKYPRDFKKDEILAQKTKIDIILYPSVDEMYPKSFLTFVEVSKITDGLCGQFRPGHFRGVTTVVNKLINIVQPDVMYLGQKDAQQAIVIKKMVSDLNMPLKVKILPTIREKDGLAMSSRNSYLTPEERKAAPVIYQSLKSVETMIKAGEHRAGVIVNIIHKIITERFAVKVDYIECVNADTLSPLGTLTGNVLIALAVWFGQTRLIDNIIVRIK